MTSQIDGAALRALIERVERATGPHKELDAAVWLHLPEQERHAWKHDGDKFAHAHQIAGCSFIPTYTTSLDAVVALVERYDPEQSFPWSVHQVIGEKYYSATIEGDEDVSGGEGEGKSPALALLLAFLRAKNLP